MATQRQIFLPIINLIRSHQGKAPLRAEGEAAPGVTDVTSTAQQETLLGKRRNKSGYDDTRMRAGADDQGPSWYKTTLG